MAVDQHWLISTALATSSLIAVVANLLLLLVFCRRRGLRTVSNRFTINLLLTNLLSSLLLIPLMIVDNEIAPSLKNVTIYTTDSVKAEKVFLQVENASSINEYLIQEEIVESDLFEQSEKVISDKFKLAVFSGGDDGSNKSVYGKIKDITFLESEVNDQSISSFLCHMAQSAVGLVCAASILSVLLIGIDQYFAVIHSLRYHSYIDKFRSMALIFACWFMSVFFGIFGALTQNDSNLWRFCVQTSNETKVLNIEEFHTFKSIYAISYFAFVIFLPFMSICIIYVCIYAAAHNNSERMRQSTKGNSQPNLNTYMQIPTSMKAPSESRLDFNLECQNTEANHRERSPTATSSLPKVQSAPNFSNLINAAEEVRLKETANVKRTCSERVSFISNLKYRISNASVFRYREETRAARISILVIFMVLVCYFPLGLAILLNSPVVGIKTPQLFNFIALILLVLSNIISPFLFAYRNRRIRRELLRFLRIEPAGKPNGAVRKTIVRPHSVMQTSVQKERRIEEECERTEMGAFLGGASNGIPQVIVTCKVENDRGEKSSILKRVCSGKNWQNYKKCSFITVPESCWQTDSARGSFSSASTQISTED